MAKIDFFFSHRVVSLKAWIQSEFSHYPWVQMSLWCQTVKRTIQQMSDGAYCLYQSLFSHTHTYSHTPSLSSGPISLSPLLLSNGPANFLVHFTEMWQIPCDTKGVRAPQSWSLAHSPIEQAGHLSAYGHLSISVHGPINLRANAWCQQTAKQQSRTSVAS